MTSEPLRTDASLLDLAGALFLALGLGRGAGGVGPGCVPASSQDVPEQPLGPPLELSGGFLLHRRLQGLAEGVRLDGDAGIRQGPGEPDPHGERPLPARHAPHRSARQDDPTGNTNPTGYRLSPQNGPDRIT